VGNASVVEGVTSGACSKGLLIFHDSVLETLNLVSEPPVLQGGISLPVGDRCEAACWIMYKRPALILCWPQGYFAWCEATSLGCWSCWTRNWKGTDDLAGKMLDRLIDVFDDIWMGWGYGQIAVYDRWYVESSSGKERTLLAWICG